MPGHKSNDSKRTQRERFHKMHPEGRKLFSINKKIKRISTKIIRLQLQLDILKRKALKLNAHK